MTSAPGPLHGVRVLDLSRVLAGPTACQTLGDLGADVVKVEHPQRGDDTRRWGPPFCTDRDGERSDATYYLCANRNKRAVALDMDTPDDRDTLLALMGRAHIVVENFKPGSLARRGLFYDDVKDRFPGLIWCSISGFGHTGPEREKPGYDLLVQGRAGLMSITGAPDGDPTKVGVAIADLMCGAQAVTAILAALHHQTRTGEGQFIDCALFDSTLAGLANRATAYLNTGATPQRLGNNHPQIVPYQPFATASGPLLIAVGNDRQYERFCDVINHPELATDVRFCTNAGRVEHRETLVPLLQTVLATQPRNTWRRRLDHAGIPCAPVQDLAEAFDDPVAHARGMRVTMNHAERGPTDVIGSPIRMSRTPVTYRLAPPTLGEHQDAVLAEWLGR